METEKEKSMQETRIKGPVSIASLEINSQSFEGNSNWVDCEMIEMSAQEAKNNLERWGDFIYSLQEKLEEARKYVYAQIDDRERRHGKR